MLGVNDLFYLATPHTASLFYEDVVSWMTANEVRFVEQAKFTGKTGYDHMFEFVIPRSRKNPERIVKPINRPIRDPQWIWFRLARHSRDSASEARAYALLNDTEQTVKPDVTDAFLSYDVKPVRWSERESVREELAA